MRRGDQCAGALVLAATSLAVAFSALPIGSAPARAGAEPTHFERAVADVGNDCEDCHASIVASYRATGMARALDTIRPGEFDGLEAVGDPVRTPDGATATFRYRVEQSGGSARVVESLELGSVPHRDSARLAFAIGAGVLDRSYAAVKNGRLWFAPIEVVSASGATARHAALAPPHAMTAGQRLTVPITPDCLACHTDAPPTTTWPANLDPLAGDWTPRGIDCAACHARAAEHVAWREATEPEGATDPIVSMAAFDRVQRMSLCANCHLQGDARIELDGSIHRGPEPGEDLLARRAVFVAAQPTEEIGFVSHVERLVLSECFTASSGFTAPLACTTCHDPHVAPGAPGERERVRAACATCHATSPASTTEMPAAGCALDDERRVGEDCVSCHMARRPVFDVAAVEIHDHRIEVRPVPSRRSEALRFFESPVGDWSVFRWPDRPAPAYANDLGLLLLALYNARQMDFAAALVGAKPSARVDRLPMFHHARGVLLESRGQLAAARSAYERALELAPEMLEPASNLALLEARLGDVDAGIARLTVLLERAPAADGALRNRALLHNLRGEHEAFLADLERAMKLAPDPVVARALAAGHGALGRPDAAEHWQAAARRLDPLGQTVAPDNAAHGDHGEHR